MRRLSLVIRSRIRLLLCATAFALPVPAAELRLITAELPPYTFQMPPATVAEFPGPGQGLVQEVVVEMARRVGHSGSIEYMPWARAQQIAMTEPNVGILSLTRSPEREDKYRWLAKVVTDDLVLVGGQGVDASSLDKVHDRPTGVLLRSGAEALLREKGFTRIEPAPEEWLNAKKMKERRIDAWLAPRLMVIYAMQEVQGDLATLNIGEIVRASDIYLAASKSLPDAEAAKWEAAFAAMQADGTYQRILQKYRRVKAAPIPDDARRLAKDPVWAY
jgi:polar amino acid transport system substrate-binding protein